LLRWKLVVVVVVVVVVGSSASTYFVDKEKNTKHKLLIEQTQTLITTASKHLFPEMRNIFQNQKISLS